MFAPLSLGVSDCEIVFRLQAQAGKTRELRVRLGDFELAKDAFDSFLKRDGVMIKMVDLSKGNCCERLELADDLVFYLNRNVGNSKICSHSLVKSFLLQKR